MLNSTKNKKRTFCFQKGHKNQKLINSKILHKLFAKIINIMSTCLNVCKSLYIYVYGYYDNIV